jgi:hypothetical protein
MRSLALATILFLSSSLVPTSAQQDEVKSPAPNQPQTTPVQPERTPQQSDQSRAQDRQRAEDTRIDRDWRTHHGDDDHREHMRQNDVGRMRDRMGRDMDEDHRSRNWRMRPDDDRADRDGYGRGYYDEDRPRRRVKVCVEYEDGDEYCRYR